MEALFTRQMAKCISIKSGWHYGSELDFGSYDAQHGGDTITPGRRLSGATISENGKPIVFRSVSERGV